MQTNINKHKYEITILADLTSDVESIKKFLVSAFSVIEIEVTKLDRSELAYEVNKSKKGNYFVAKLQAPASSIDEFRRRAKLNPQIWRFIDINMDEEFGLKRKIKNKVKHRPWFLRNRARDGKPHEKSEQGQRFNRGDRPYHNKFNNKKPDKVVDKNDK